MITIALHVAFATATVPPRNNLTRFDNLCQGGALLIQPLFISTSVGVLYYNRNTIISIVQNPAVRHLCMKYLNRVAPELLNPLSVASLNQVLFSTTIIATAQYYEQILGLANNQYQKVYGGISHIWNAINPGHSN